MKRLALAAVMAAAFAAPLAAPITARAADAGVDAGEPSFAAPGDLVPKSGQGRVDEKIYAPDMRFPIEEGPAFANSQVYGHGGGSGPAGTGQCDEENFSYPWRDNYCETRQWDMPLCPSGTGHQGQDIRGATCKKDVHWVVAVTDGTITNVGSYSVYLTAADGTRYDYLHMSNVAVNEGDKVQKGQRMGMVSNVFGGTPTTVHLHFNIRQNVAGVGSIFVPPYTSLIQSYRELLNPTPPPAPTPTAEPAPPPAPPEEAPPPAEAETGCACRTVPGPTGSLAAIAAALLLVGAAVVRRRA